MHPLLMHGYLCWCILLGYLYVSALSLGSVHYRGRGTGSEGWLRDFGSALSYGSKSSTYFLVIFFHACTFWVLMLTNSKP